MHKSGQIFFIILHSHFSWGVTPSLWRMSTYCISSYFLSTTSLSSEKFHPQRRGDKHTQFRELISKDLLHFDFPRQVKKQPRMEGGVTHRFIETNGINMHIAEQGSGPAVLLLHGFPSLWYMWRRQMQALADAGYHAIAPDQRGYGQTGGPDGEDEYTVMHLVGDIIGLLDALGEQQVLMVGHDWGAIVGWWLCLLRPDRVKGYVAVAVPAISRPPGETDWVQRWNAALGEGYYLCRFQEPGRAERDFATVGTEATLKAFTCSFWDTRTGDVVRNCVAPKDKELSAVFHTGELPSWYSEEDLKYCVEQFEKTGFTGALNWYRNFGRSYKLLAPWVGATVSTKAYFIAGEDCALMKFPGVSERLKSFKHLVPNLKDIVIIKDAAHFVMEEQPKVFNEKILTFLAELQK